jgi:hypothetical protein
VTERQKDGEKKGEESAKHNEVQDDTDHGIDQLARDFVASLLEFAGGLLLETTHSGPSSFLYDQSLTVQSVDDVRNRWENSLPARKKSTPVTGP